VVYHTNGTITSYVPTSSTNLARGNALVKAIAACKTGESIRLGPGTFQGNFVLPTTKSGLTIQGSGKDVTTLMSHTNATRGTAVLTIHQGASTAVNAHNILDLTISQNHTATTNERYCALVLTDGLASDPVGIARFRGCKFKWTHAAAVIGGGCDFEANEFVQYKNITPGYDPPKYAFTLIRGDERPLGWTGSAWYGWVGSNSGWKANNGPGVWGASSPPDFTTFHTITIPASVTAGDGTTFTSLQNPVVTQSSMNALRFNMAWDSAITDLRDDDFVFQLYTSGDVQIGDNIPIPTLTGFGKAWQTVTIPVTGTISGTIAKVKIAATRTWANGAGKLHISDVTIMDTTRCDNEAWVFDGYDPTQITQTPITVGGANGNWALSTGNNTLWGGRWKDNLISMSNSPTSNLLVRTFKMGVVRTPPVGHNNAGGLASMDGLGTMQWINNIVSCGGGVNSNITLFQALGAPAHGNNISVIGLMFYPEISTAATWESGGPGGVGGWPINTPVNYNGSVYTALQAATTQVPTTETHWRVGCDHHPESWLFSAMYGQIDAKAVDVRTQGMSAAALAGGMHGVRSIHATVSADMTNFNAGDLAGFWKWRSDTYQRPVIWDAGAQSFRQMDANMQNWVDMPVYGNVHKIRSRTFKVNPCVNMTYWDNTHYMVKDAVNAMTITALRLVFTEATDNTVPTGANNQICIEREGGAEYYVALVNIAQSQAVGATQTLTVAQAAITAGTDVIVTVRNYAGTGTGAFYVELEYTVP